MASGKFGGYRSDNIAVNKKFASPSYARYPSTVVPHPDTFGSISDIRVYESPAIFILVYVVT
jgi:hypothetical protein